MKYLLILFLYALSIFSFSMPSPTPKTESKTDIQEIITGKKIDRRKRTKINKQQKNELEEYYATNQNPDANDKKALSAKTGLLVSVIKVWFQNRRAKEKRIVKIIRANTASSLYTEHQETFNQNNFQPTIYNETIYHETPFQQISPSDFPFNRNYSLYPLPTLVSPFNSHQQNTLYNGQRT